MDQEQDECLIVELERLPKFPVMLNKEKCVFTRYVKFLDYDIDQEGIKPDLEKVRAIQDIKEPKSVSELGWFLDMCNHLRKFSPDLAETIILYTPQGFVQ